MRYLGRFGFSAFQNFDNNDKPNKYEESDLNLDDLIGLDVVKKTINEIKAFCIIQNKRKSMGLKNQSLVLHMIFKGNPGTGKTTVARILGKIFKEIGILEKGHVVEVDRADLVGEYIGHTALKVRENIKKALGGILFVDEAYSLARGGDRDFGKEAIDTLVKAMEDHKNEFILILAGYTNEMNWFMEINPGLKSRFPIQIDFPDYTLDELMQIALKMFQDREYELAELSKKKLLHILSHKYSYDSGNARTVRNIVELSIRKHAMRIVNKTNLKKDDLILIQPEDITE
ncbi:stage V sporulation protein K [Caldanaerobius fijiensis DSM 17918]|uniref:Stage V sporulation protein K n=1 Tax=Caldanaerobius fijiensis DSM 17918 TaxID=1121256 RepID=A0A1M4YCX0_9THEO|nr:AAA family ATPase [Caldanaerobius fijiensis]SHF03539.1 stage V sporulation protein K [Caldanaerobius fijiensis DSM 17918]